MASSLGAEDQVLTHMLRQRNLPVEIFTIDTGRLYPETLELLAVTEKKYGFRYKVYTPDSASVETFVKEKGVDSIYDSLANRKACCYMRKVEPLERALQGAGGWVTGLRRNQSAVREDVSHLSIDESHGGIYKLCPLAGWSDGDLWDYIRAHGIPYNKLHDQGYPSIGCEPCTRAVKAGEDIRAGRWWWEQSEQKECGLHLER
jgi:phosphoadenosine phosphosulfate reductase